MPRFHFRLATLLRVRESTRDERRVELAEADRADALLGKQLSRLQEQEIQLQREFRAAARPGVVDVRRLLQMQQYAVTLRAQAAELMRQRQALAGEIDRRRQALLAADREFQVVDKLRQNHTHAHRLEEDRQEYKQLEEAALHAVR